MSRKKTWCSKVFHHPAILPSCHPAILPCSSTLSFRKVKVSDSTCRETRIPRGKRPETWRFFMEVMCVFPSSIHHVTQNFQFFSLLDGFPMVRWFCTWLFTLFSHVRISIEHGHVERCQLLQKCRCRHSIRLDMGQSWALQNFNVIFIELDASWWLIDLIGNISWSF